MDSPKNESHNSFNYYVEKELVKQFEDWKQEQIILFTKKMKSKEKQILKELNTKWINRKNQIDEELTHEIMKCKNLSKHLDNIADMLKEKQTIVTVKELEVCFSVDKIKNEYISLFQNVQSSNAQTINEFSNTILELKTKLHSTQQKNMLLLKENEFLKNDINSNCKLRIQQLENKIFNLNSNYEEAIKSCMFYKERWITSVRKINQMYSNHHGNKINENLLNKQNIQNTLSTLLVEQKHDEEILREFLNDLAKLRQDISNTI